MFRFSIIAVAALSIACGSDMPEAQPTTTSSKSSPNASQENSPPVISAVEISPEAPVIADGLTASVQVKDPDRDSIDLEIEWYRNGVLLDVEEQAIAPFTFVKGDRVHVIAHADDGEAQVTFQSDVIEFRNSVPQVNSLEIDPERPRAGDLLEAKVEAADVDEDQIQYEYRWLVSGHPLEGQNGSRLAPGSFAKNERIVAQVKVRDGDDESPWFSSAPLRVANAAPRIVSEPTYALSGPSRYDYQIRAQDPDGDTPLKYELTKGPAGMSVNAVSGQVVWHLQPGVSGNFPVEVTVSDPYGAAVTQTYSLNVDWSASETQGGGTVPAAGAQDDLDEDTDDAPDEEFTDEEEEADE